MDVRNDSHQGNCPKTVGSSSFCMWVWGVISFHSSKKLPDPLHPKPAKSILTLHNSCDLIPGMYGTWQRVNFCPRYRYILSYIAYTQTCPRTCNSRGKSLAPSDHGYENLTDVPLRSVFFNSSPLWPMGIAKDGLKYISWKPLSQRYIIVSLFYSTSNIIGVTAKTSLKASCVKEKLTL